MAFADTSEYELEDLINQTPGRRGYCPSCEDQHWLRAHASEPYFLPGFDYEDYAPAYCVGYSGCAQYGGAFEETDKSLRANWERIKGDSRLSWEQALPAVRAAWFRLEQRTLAVA